MTNPACATRTGKVAMTKAQWRPPLHAADVIRKHTRRAGMSALTCKATVSPLACVARDRIAASTARGDADTGRPSFAQPTATQPATKHAARGGRAPRLRRYRRYAHPTHVFPRGVGGTPRPRSGDNGPALEFKPGGT